MTRHWTRTRAALLCSGALALKTLAGCGCEETRESAPSARITASTSVTGARGPRTQSGTARLHLPPGCELALAVDAQALLQNPILGKHLLVGLGDPSVARPGSSPPLGVAQRAFAAMLDELELRPKRDLKEVAVCVVDLAGKPRFVVVMSGSFRGGVAASLQRHSPSDQRYENDRIAGVDAVGREGKWLTQASDNAILFGDDKPLLERALKLELSSAYPLPTEQDVALLLVGGKLPLAVGPDPLSAPLSRAKDFQLGVDLGKGVVRIRALLANENDAALVHEFVKANVRVLEERAKQGTGIVPADVRPWLEALGGVKTDVDGTRLALQVEVQPGMIEMALQQLFMASMLSAAPPGGGISPGAFPGAGQLPGLSAAPLPTIGLSPTAPTTVPSGLSASEPPRPNPR